MSDQRAINEANAQNEVRIIEQAIPQNVAAGDFALAAANFGDLADLHADLGLLHWRHGEDPRPQFDRGLAAYDKMRVLAHEHALARNISEIPVVYAMLSLLGQTTPIEFEDEAYHAENRWPCYQCCLVHALHDQPLNARHQTLLTRYLNENDALADRIMLTYLQLLGLRASEDRADALVNRAEENWLKRKQDRFFSGVAPAYEGYGTMNDIYVDIYLAAVLKKIGWTGESIHRWRW